jgi:hypothetical protein
MHLIDDLRHDTSSRLQAALAGWDYPATREAIVLMDLFDLQHNSKSKRKIKPYPRPWPVNQKKIGGKKTTRRSPADVRAIMRPSS